MQGKCLGRKKKAPFSNAILCAMISGNENYMMSGEKI